MTEHNPLAETAASLVREIHAAGTPLALAATGGGSQAIAALLGVPGGSRCVLEAIVPYSAAALTAFLGARPEQFCNEHTARLMAMAAYQRALAYQTAGGTAGSVAGVGCTASLVSDRPKHGAHRIHVAAQTASTTTVASLELVKGERERAGEERVAAQMLLNMVAQACGVRQRLLLDLKPEENVAVDAVVAPPLWQQLFVGEIDAALARGEASDRSTARRVSAWHDEGDEPAPSSVGVESIKPAAFLTAPRRVLFPGAFHPLHAGHRAMARCAAKMLNLPVEWELSIANVDKPPIDFFEMRTRVEQFPESMAVWLTRAPTFVEKSAIFPVATFVVGADTITRIAEPRYYKDDANACRQAIQDIAARGCRFLVFGRKTTSGFETLSQLSLPPALCEICDEVPESAFRMDLSSTEIRQAATSAE